MLRGQDVLTLQNARVLGQRWNSALLLISYSLKIKQDVLLHLLLRRQPAVWRKRLLPPLACAVHSSLSSCKQPGGKLP